MKSRSDSTVLSWVIGSEFGMVCLAVAFVLYIVAIRTRLFSSARRAAARVRHEGDTC